MVEIGMLLALALVVMAAEYRVSLCRTRAQTVERAIRNVQDELRHQEPRPGPLGVNADHIEGARIAIEMVQDRVRGASEKREKAHG